VSELADIAIQNYLLSNLCIFETRITTPVFLIISEDATRAKSGIMVIA